MALLDRESGPKGPKPPKDVEDKQKRGREQMLRGAAARRLYLRVWRGDTYWYLNSKGALSFQPTVTNPGNSGKPPHRIRNRYNFIEPIIQGKVSAVTQRVPSYETLPTTNDPEDRNAASLASQVALYGYDKWRLRRKCVEAVEYALVCGEAFALPYFDPNVGPYIINPDTEEVVGRGEVKVKILFGNEVYWEPGCDFDESPWWCIEQARPKDEVQQIPGYVGGELVPDATTSDVPTDRVQGSDDQMVLVTEYFERPCPKYPRGRRIIMANGKVIAPVEEYPVRDTEGNVLDEPVMHRLSWTVDPDSDRDRGLVEQLDDLNKTAQDCWNKLLEYKNRGLMPKLTAPRGSDVDPPMDDVPGKIHYYNVVGGAKPEWEQSIKVPQELVQMREDAIRHMLFIASDSDIQAGPDVAAKTVNAVVEQNQSRWQTFIVDYAEWHSRVMRSCLALVALHYTEPQLLEIRGRYGAEPIPDFRGAQLRGQVNVRVLPGSIESKSRQSIREELEFLVTAFPGALSVETALAALNGGNAEALLQSYELDVRHAHDLIQQLKQGPQAFLAFPDRLDVDLARRVPWWMPRKQDNVAVHKHVFADYMKTEEFFQLPPETQHIFDLYWEGLEWIEKQRALKQAMEAQEMAASQGLGNAAAPQIAPAPPSGPRISEAEAPPE